MAIQFFGQYLIERNVITPEQLLDAIAYQEATNKLNNMTEVRVIK